MKPLFLFLFFITFSTFAGIFGNDNRVLILTESFPYSAIGRITIAGSICTGTLIGPCQILTAKHCVAELDSSTPYNYPMEFTSHGKKRKAKLIKHFFDKSTNPPPTKENDWAISILDKNLGSEIGFFKVKRQGPYSRPIYPLIIAGFNSDLYAGQKITADFNVTSHLIYSMNIMSMEADTFAGSSGAAIWSFNQYDEPEVIGVNVRAPQIIDPLTNKRSQKYLDRWSESNNAQGVASEQFWRAYQESLQEKCQ